MEKIGESANAEGGKLHAIAEGKKPLTTRDLGEPAGYGAPPQKPTQFFTFYAKMEYIFGYVNLECFSSQIEQIVDELSFH